MPRIPTIVAKESPIAGAPASAATGEEFGAGIGQALQGLGNTIQQVGAQFGQIGAQREAEKRQYDVSMAIANSTYAPKFNETVTSYPDASGAGLTTTIADDYDKYADNMLADYIKAHPGDKKGADAIKLQLAQDKKLYVTKASANEAELAGNNAKALADSGLATQANDVRANGATTETEFNIALSKSIQLIQTQPHLSAADKAAAIRNQTTQLASARFAAMADAATTLPAITEIERQLKQDTWSSKFGTTNEYESMKRYVETAKNSILTESRTKTNSLLSGLKSQAGHAVIGDQRLQATIDEIAATGVTMTPTQLADWEYIITSDNRLRELQGQPASTVNSASHPGVPAGGPTRITYANQKATRNLPVNAALGNIYSQAAQAAGIAEVRVVSGGQPATGPNRTGSHRHDLGNAGDIQLIMSDGRVLDFRVPSDRAIIEKFVATAWGLGATGIGAGEDYMGSKTLHVGFGRTAVWGKGGAGIYAPAWLRRATRGAPGMAGKSLIPGGGLNLLPAAQQGVVQTVGNTYGVDANLLAGIWRQESGGFLAPAKKPGDVAYGPFQFTLQTWAQYGKGGDINNFDQAADAAARYMKDLLNQFHGDTTLALMAYNWGPGAVRGWMKEGRDPNAIPTETKEYVAKVMGYASGGTVEGANAVSGTQFDQQVVDKRFLVDQEAGLNAGVIDYIQTPNGGGQTVSALTINSSPEEWTARSMLFDENKEKYSLQQSQMHPFSKAEMAAFGDLMASNDAAKQLAVLAGIANFSPQNQQAAYDDLGKVDPVFAQAGRAYADGRKDAALGILEGRKLTKTEDGLKTPWQDDANELYPTLVGNAFAGIDVNARAAMKGSVDALYAYNTRTSPTSGVFDPVAYEAAIEQVTGMNLDTVNGVQVLLPPDLDAETVQTAMSVMTMDQWTNISEDRLRPMGLNGAGELVPLEDWAMEGAVLFMVDDEGWYDVYVDGEQPITSEGRPFRIQLLAPEIKQIVAEGLIEAERVFNETGEVVVGQQPAPGTAVPGTVAGQLESIAGETEALNKGLEALPQPPAEARTKDDKASLPPLMRNAVRQPRRMKDDRGFIQPVARNAVRPALPPSPFPAESESAGSQEKVIQWYQEVLDESNLDQATKDRFMKEFKERVEKRNKRVQRPISGIISP